ncbi:MAG: DUF2911 domain-containing protein [Gemmatimonadetes bacterium]|nr:DUF2911 domain-containing protein [Gemmatimonadota bacterium]
MRFLSSSAARRLRRLRPLDAALVVLTTMPVTAAAQGGAFITRLGTDTVQVETFARSGARITGAIVTRAPTARLLRYEITLAPDGRFASYVQTTWRGDGAPLGATTARASLTYQGDTIVREAPDRSGALVTDRIAAPEGAFPLGTIPLGMSFLVLEHALGRARLSSGTPAMLHRLALLPTQRTPSHTSVLYAARDSVDVDYFGQGRFGATFDRDGALLRSDWRNTTYQVVVTRVPAIDVERIGAAWHADDVAGRGAGALSPRDSVPFTVGRASGAIVYARPAARGRSIWGGVVPWDRIWRLGADFATRLHLTDTLQIGPARIPAGEYTLWMLPSPTQPLLVVSRLQRVFGTQYTPAQDLVRVPLAVDTGVPPTERLTLAVRDATLTIAWGDRTYRVALTPP